MSPRGPRVHDKPRRVHRVGLLPDPWSWTPWQYGPFTGRWDDPDAIYRVLYTGASRYVCLLEVLAPYRPDPALLAAYSELDSDPDDHRYPTKPIGVVPLDWIAPRAVATATLTGGTSSWEPIRASPGSVPTLPHSW